MDIEKPTKEHQWLQKFVGEWTSEADATMEPGQPPQKFTGTESVRSIAGMWIIAEGKSPMPGGGEGSMFLTLGYNPQKKQYIGTWLGSMMSTLWVYTGQLDPTGKKLELHTSGPNPGDPTKTANFRETIEFLSDDHRTFTSAMKGDNGEWTTFMTASYRRVKK